MKHSSWAISSNIVSQNSSQNNNNNNNKSESDPNEPVGQNQNLLTQEKELMKCKIPNFFFGQKTFVMEREREREYNK